MDNFYSNDYTENNNNGYSFSNTQLQFDDTPFIDQIEDIIPSIFLFIVIISCLSMSCCVLILHKICKAMIRNNRRYRNRSNHHHHHQMVGIGVHQIQNV